MGAELKHKLEWYGLDPIISIAETCRVMGWSRSTHWREVKAGRFRAPVQTSRGRKGHFASYVRAVQEKLKKAYQPDVEVA